MKKKGKFVALNCQCEVKPVPTEQSASTHERFSTQTTVIFSQQGQIPTKLQPSPQNQLILYLQ